MKDHGYKYLRILEGPELDPQKRANRVRFGEVHSRDREWKRIFFLDESTFRAYSKRRSCYQRRDSRVYKGTLKYPSKVNLIGMISPRGPSLLILFTENMDAELFLKFLKLLKKDAANLYKDQNYRIYMDNDRKHTSGTVRSFVEKKGMDVPLDWPSPPLTSTPSRTFGG